ncbi:MAG: carbohydrate-binding family 9-like protein [Sandaracinus sp.]
MLDGALDDDAWRDAPPIAITADYAGVPVASPTTAIRFAWDEGALYVAFEGSFDAPLTAPATPPEIEAEHLYGYDVVELFVDADPSTPRTYRELELGPRGHFLDIAVDLDARPHGDVTWSSGLTHAERIEDDTHRFVVEVRLPAAALDLEALAPRAMHIGLFRITGHSPAPRLFLSRFPTGTPRPQFHVPERFGTLTLAP